jgi:hypothetical protein
MIFKTSYNKIFILIILIGIIYSNSITQSQEGFTSEIKGFVNPKIRHVRLYFNGMIKKIKEYPRNIRKYIARF